MNYKLTHPCDNCPFLRDKPFGLHKARCEEIVHSLLSDGSFPCHKTIEYDEEGEASHTPTTQHCAGAMILLEKLERPNQMMRIAERLWMYDRSKLDMEAPVYQDFFAFMSGASRNPHSKRRNL